MQVENRPEKKLERGAAWPAPQESGRRKYWIALASFLVVAAAFAFGVLPRVKARNTAQKETAQLAVPFVSVVRPAQAPPAQEIVLPANVQPYSSAPIFARTNGYLKQWYVDIGAHVKKGQLLAVIEAPEVNQQLQQARGTLATAEANMHLSEITARRYTDLLKTNSVSHQDADNALASYKANQATVQANQANVRQLEQIVSYEQVYAPFDGVIDVRNTDIGALINSGSGGGTQTQLFHIVHADKLRVYVNVPEAYSQAARPGLAAQLVLAEFPGQPFTGKLVRTAQAIDPATRTLLVEVEVNNPTGKLFSGSYAELHLKLPATHRAYVVPAETLLFRFTGLHIATVNNGQVLVKTVKLGRDFGNTVEVAEGLAGDESVIVNPPDSIATGDKVQVASASSGNPAPAPGNPAPAKGEAQ
jgi:RND family efflux transporter MFP subunit